jgi:hypothetical protein
MRRRGEEFLTPTIEKRECRKESKCVVGLRLRWDMY